MEASCEYISYESTGYFSRMMIDYVKSDEKLKPFYKHPVSLDGIQASIEARNQFDTPRDLLVTELRKQYSDLPLSQSQEQNLGLLLKSNTFTICTAHQPNIFTGPLFFIYKILHTIKLANHLNSQIPNSNFVPVYYMGSEDADLDELGHIYLDGEKLEWETKQTGAVGRMKVDKLLIKLLDRIAGQVEVAPFGKELVLLFKEAYKEGVSIQQATLHLVNELFKDFGLVVLIPDNAELKRQFQPIVKRELIEQFSHQVVEKTTEQLGEHYKVQASGREINLFYLTETKRERIEKDGVGYKVEGLGLAWNHKEMMEELNNHPERFSANVILRGLFQESILPNIAFIGGGGEIAYWLELKQLFENCNVPYPLLIIRNSFLLTEEKDREAADRLGFETTDLFQATEKLVNTLVTRESSLQLSLGQEKEQLRSFYGQLSEIANKIDPTLSQHTVALQTKALEKVEALERKMLRAEKRKFEAQQRQISKLRNQLFPSNSLQERQENFSLFYGKYGRQLLQKMYDASLSLEQEFGIIELLDK
ncbi:bacillithiol biosynthesis cysteine-adding enzyme BshC [Segetibacter aerophilus]|uniref:Putative cysteine ligase BshC n=1 Tax=Segetibacter aerophilus TaxID=670293 RepID=A0A512B9E7_9BACT|nr:bacillithiol biosynthesis cysteine-adding enzyme BshC [Segetibacter aerophilus]GEO08563.1 putative cysteine ligase BshC [Segetibacter aerophilus]